MKFLNVLACGFLFVVLVEVVLSQGDDATTVKPQAETVTVGDQDAPTVEPVADKATTASPAVAVTAAAGDPTVPAEQPTVAAADPTVGGAAEATTAPPEADETTVNPDEAVAGTTEASKESVAPDAGSTAASGTEAAAAVTEATTEAPAAGTEAPDEQTTAAVSVAEVATTEADQVTTEAPQMTTESEEMTTVIPDDPCEPYGSKIIEDDRRHFSYEGKEGEYICDDEIASRWYAFKYEGQWAEITTTCIKGGQCGTMAPYTLNVEEGEELPQVEGEEMNTTLCEMAAVIRGSNIIPNCCFYKYPVVVRKCKDHYTYNMQPVPTKRCSTGACIQLPDEVVAYEYLGDPPPTEPPTTEAPTTVLPLNLPIMDQSDMSEAQKAGIVTAVYEYPHEDLQADFEGDFDIVFRRKIAEALNNLPLPPTEAPEETTAAEITTAAPETAAPTQESEDDDGELVQVELDKLKDAAVDNKKTGPDVPNLDAEDAGKGPGKRRRRRDEEKKYTEDDVYYAEGTPRTRDGELDAAILVKDGDNGAVSQDKLMEAMDSINGTADSGVGDHALITYYAGMPEDLETAAVTPVSSSVWDAHLALFITIIILALICLIIIIIGICCIKCKGRRGQSSDKTPVTMEEGKKGKKVPMVIENPVSDEEITRDEAPMVERENPAVTPNGGGQHISKKDEDNGWVVPLDELSKAERDQAEVENTKF